MRHILILPFICALVLLSGCSFDEMVADARKTSEQAQTALAGARVEIQALRDTVASFEDMLAEARTLAEQSKSPEAAAAVNKIQAMQVDALAALTKAETAIPRLEAIAVTSEKAFKEAEETRAAGGGVWETIAGLAAAAGVPGLAFLQAHLKNQRLRTAVRVSANHADRMEGAETDEAVREAKKLSVLEQETLRVRDLIQAARNK